MAEQDSLTMEKDGTVTAVVTGEKTVLRRPLMGELRSLREALWGAQDSLYDKAASLNEARAKLKTASDTGDPLTAVDALREYRELERQDTTANEDACLAWMRVAFEMLGNRALPEDAALPVWMSDGGTVTALMEHWRERPLAPGPA